MTMETLEESAQLASVAALARDLRCGYNLARDLLTLAGGDEELVRTASASFDGIESVKAAIIDGRFKKSE